jgi:type 1 glutamine amidotransferase
MTVMPRVMILSGDQEFGDRWHDLAATSAILSRIVAGDGHHVVVRNDVQAALATAPPVDLLVFNTSLGGTEPGAGTALAPASVAGLEAHVGAGAAILAVHSAVMSFPAWPRWGEIIGARWLPDVSGHPPQATAAIRILADAGRGIADGLRDFDTDDERYTDLGLLGPRDVVAEHDEAGRPHPLAWVRSEGAAAAPIGYLGLGHDASGYRSPTHRELVRRFVSWACRSISTSPRSTSHRSTSHRREAPYGSDGGARKSPAGGSCS